jgi:hypothetical protein
MVPIIPAPRISAWCVERYDAGVSRSDCSGYSSAKNKCFPRKQMWRMDALPQPVTDYSSANFNPHSVKEIRQNARFRLFQRQP